MAWLKILILTLSLSFSSSCSGLKVDLVEHRGHSIEREILPYVQKFERDCDKKVRINIGFERIKWDILKKNVVGYCFDLGITYVNLDYDWWKNNQREDEREQLVYHELGHCILKKYLHDDSMIYVDTFGGRPASIMYPFVFGYQNEYALHRDYYIKELCGK